MVGVLALSFIFFIKEVKQVVRFHGIAHFIKRAGRILKKVVSMSRVKASPFPKHGWGFRRGRSKVSSSPPACPCSRADRGREEVNPEGVSA